MSGKHQFDYDGYEEEDYDDDYDDAADDWEAEAAEEEQKAQAEAALKAALAEKKLQTRAPAATEKNEKEDNDEPAMPEDVMNAVAQARQMANDIAAGSELVNEEGRTHLLADAPAETAEDMKALGAQIASHLLSFSSAPNFDVVLSSIFESLGNEFKTIPAINEVFTRVEKATEASKKSNKATKKKNAKGTTSQAANVGDDALNMDVEDRGGAYLEQNDSFF